MSLLLDAKYRVRYEDDFVRQYGAPGPDIDSVNVMHRYRDAILDVHADQPDAPPKRTIIQAAALFPFRDTSEYSFRNSKLWQSIDRLGIGAIPLLPENKIYLTEWLRTVLNRGTWSMADRAISHKVTDHVNDWRTAASEGVLLAALRSQNTREHFDWICENRCYFMPARKEHPRQLTVKSVAIYSPLTLRPSGGAITHQAAVEKIEVLPRRAIQTPWKSSSDPDELYVVYSLSDVTALKRPILNSTGQRFSSVRWSSRLGLQRAQTLKELLLEVEPEWKLYEELRAENIPFKLKAAAPGTLSETELNWRAWFVVTDSLRFRYAGLAGFVCRTEHNQNSFPNVRGVIDRISAEPR